MLAAVSNRRTRTTALSGWLALWLFLFTTLAGRATTLTAEEQQIANYLTTASGQTRDKAAMHTDDRLIAVARARAQDMARRNYVSHVNPDGNGPNYLVRATGYTLPAWWGTDRAANYVESLGVGYTTASETWTALMASPHHRAHLLAEDAFFRDQTSYGVGHYFDAGSTYKHYWVIITAPPSDLPTLTITAPVEGGKLTTFSVLAKGRVSGDGIYAHLQYRLDTPAGTGVWKELALPAGKATGAWSVNLTGLIPGTHTLRARTLKTDGSTAKEVASTFRYIVVTPLKVSVDGPGKVSDGFLGTHSREVGALLSIRATAAADFIFDQWEGLPDTPGLDVYKAAQTFAMADGLALTAHFIASPFTALASAFRGLITAPDAAHARSGELLATLTKGGGFSGVIYFGGHRYAIKGLLNSLGDATVNVPRPGLSTLALTLHLDVTGADPTLHGVLNDGLGDLAIAADHNATDPALAGRYNVGIAPDATAAATPQGYGYAMISVSAGGTATLTGTLANGAVFTTSTHTTAGHLVFYKTLYTGSGALSGELTLDAATATGTVHFHKPARPTALYYASAFSTANETVGTRYTAPLGSAPCVEFAPGSTAGSVALEAGDLPATVEQTFTLGTSSSVQIPVGWKLKINPATGRYTGKFLHPSGTQRSFSGVLSQQDRVGWGFFLGTTESGTATLGAAL